VRSSRFVIKVEEGGAGRGGAHTRAGGSSYPIDSFCDAECHLK